MSKNIKKLTYSALLICVGILLPFLSASSQELGNMLCLMHIPVLLCGFICGWQWGLVAGFLTPLLRSCIVGAPMMFPTAVTMAFELAAYGMICGLLYKLFPKKNQFIYLSLIISMLAGRCVWGAAMLLISGISGGTFAFSTFVSVGFVTAIPGIIIQLVVIPILVMVLKKTKLSYIY